MSTIILPDFSIDGPGGNSPLDWRGRSGWAMTRLASWLVWKADRLQKRAYVVTRGEIKPTLPILFNQLEEVADDLGVRTSELVAGMRSARLAVRTSHDEGAK